MTQAVLWMPHSALMMARVGGLAVIERQFFLLRRAGITKVWVGTNPPNATLRIPEGLEVLWAGNSPIRPPYLAFSGDHFVRLPTLKRVLAEDSNVPVSWQDDAGKGVLQLVPVDAGDPIHFEKKRLPDGEWVMLTHPPLPALSWLTHEATKSTDGFMAKHFDRKISLAVTKRLLDTFVTPNMMTFISVAIGLAGAALLAFGQELPGALLIWLHSTLDGCDGELARLKFMESPLGGILDFWGDNVVHAALFVGLGLGLSRAQGMALPLVLGVVAALSATASAGLAFAHSRRKAAARGGAGPFFSGVADVSGAATAEKRLAAVEDALAQRDFVYLLVALAAFGRLEWFLWASAVGSPLFLVVLLWLQRPRTATGQASPTI